MNRRESLAQISGSLLMLVLSGGKSFATAAPGRRMTVYKSSSCSCCAAWVRYAGAAGYSVEQINVDDVAPYKKKYGVPSDLESCHTAIVDSAVFEGHVPVDVIERFLREAPKGASGLAVPGMPIGSPGMEIGKRHDAYDVVLWRRDGSRSIYARR